MRAMSAKLPDIFKQVYVHEYLATDTASHVFKHLQQSVHVDCRTLYSSNCFSIL